MATLPHPPAEDSVDYVYDPALRVRRQRHWTTLLRRASLVVRVIGLPLAFLPMLVAMPATMTSVGSALVQPGSAGELSEQSTFDMLAQSGVLKTLVAVGGLAVLGAALSAVHAAQGNDPPGSVRLAGENAAVGIVREARVAAVAGRSTVEALRSPELRAWESWRKG